MTEAASLTVEEVQGRLETRQLGYPLVLLDHVDSTNDTAKALARRGAAHGTVVVAESQGSGRGRLGRSWHSPPGLNLHVSVVIRPSLPIERVSLLTLVAAVALACALEEQGIESEIRWPNDVMVEGRKLAGVLTELDTMGDGGPVVILGIGINCNAGPGDFPPELADVATSLAQVLGGDVDRAVVLAAVLNSLEPLLDRVAAEGGLPAVLAEWEARWRDLGAQVSAAVPGGEAVRGTAVGLAEDGALLIDTGAAEPVRVMAGDVRSAQEEGA